MYKNELTKWVGGILVDELQEWLDGLDDNTPTSDFPDGIVGTIFKPIYASGSYTCNAWRSREWIKEHFSDIQDFVYDLRNYHYVEVPDLWESEETFQVFIMYRMSLELVAESATLKNDYIYMNDLLMDLIQEFSE